MFIKFRVGVKYIIKYISTGTLHSHEMLYWIEVFENSYYSCHISLQQKVLGEKKY